MFLHDYLLACEMSTVKTLAFKFHAIYNFLSELWIIIYDILVDIEGYQKCSLEIKC